MNYSNIIFQRFKTKGGCYEKVRYFWFSLLILCGFSSYEQTEANFTVRFTEDGEGIVIKKYIGQAT